MRGVLLLEDGASFSGEVFGRGDPQGREVVCASGLKWPELLGSPSYAGQIVVCVSGQAGDGDATGMQRCYPSGWVLNGNGPPNVQEYAWSWNVACLSGVDTDRLAEHLRRSGPLAGSISAGEAGGSLPERKMAGAAKDPKPDEVLRGDVSTDRPYRIYGGGPRVVVYDLGLSSGILLGLGALDCQVTVVPWDYPAESVLEMLPDAVVLSTGPGNPALCDSAIANLSPLVGSLPLLAVGLGHQILARALGARTGAMWCGHRGRGYPVRSLNTGLVRESTQSHGYCVLRPPPGARATHIAVGDGTIEGLEYPGLNAFSVQFQLTTPGQDPLSAEIWGRLLGSLEGRALTA